MHTRPVTDQAEARRKARELENQHRAEQGLPLLPDLLPVEPDSRGLPVTDQPSRRRRREVRRG